MNLLVDIGNTRAKLALGHPSGEVEPLAVVERLDRELLEPLVRAHGIRHGIFSSTRGACEAEVALLQELGVELMMLDAATPLPIGIDYRTPETLGRDRVAAAVGAQVRYPHRNCLVVDLGTALTLDLVTSDGVFRGGVISLGYSNRLRALNDYTATLPLCETLTPEGELPLQGHTTREAIERGVFNSVCFEIESYQRRLKAEFADLCVIVTGGEAKYFEKQIKNAIFAEPNLVFCGLNRILEYNLTQNATAKQ